MKFLAANTLSIALLLFAAYLVHTGTEGWGWVVGAAVLCGAIVKSKSKE